MNVLRGGNGCERTATVEQCLGSKVRREPTDAADIETRRYEDCHNKLRYQDVKTSSSSTLYTAQQDDRAISTVKPAKGIKISQQYSVKVSTQVSVHTLDFP